MREWRERGRRGGNYLANTLEVLENTLGAHQGLRDRDHVGLLHCSFLRALLSLAGRGEEALSVLRRVILLFGRRSLASGSAGRLLLLCFQPRSVP